MWKRAPGSPSRPWPPMWPASAWPIPVWRGCACASRSRGGFASPARWAWRSSGPQGTLAELAFIALGSNVDPERNLPRAVHRLAEIGSLRAVSMVYQNPAIGPAGAPDFLNAAVLIEAELAAMEIHDRLRAIEAELGRVRTANKYAPRPIDLDLCLVGAQIVTTPELVLPDPDLLTRPHLAVTLGELAPDFRHPETGEKLRAIAERLRQLSDHKPRPDVAQLIAAARP